MRLSRIRLRVTQIASWRLRWISSTNYSTRSRHKIEVSLDNDVHRTIKEQTILLPPRIRIVTALLFVHSSMQVICSELVPKLISFTRPALPSLLWKTRECWFRVQIRLHGKTRTEIQALTSESSSNRGTIRPLVATAISSRSGPPTLQSHTAPIKQIASAHHCVTIIRNRSTHTTAVHDN